MIQQTSADDEKKVSVTITNRHLTPITLYVEPWGDEHQIPPNKTFRIDFRADSLQAIPIIYEGDSITVEGWQGATAEIWFEGQMLN